MQFPDFHPSGPSITILQVGDVVKVRAKEYNDRFTTHYVLIEARGVVDDVPFVEFTDLHVGGYSTSLSRKTLSTSDQFWAGLAPVEMEEALDAFQSAKAAQSKRETDALARYEEEHAAHVSYQMLADRIYVG